MPNQSNCILTVLIPTFNAMPFLPGAVESILGQTYKNFKLLIIDGGSTDETWEYLKSLEDPRLSILQKPKCGIGATGNKALELCDTPFLARMDADDVAHPERLECQMELLLQDSKVGIVGCQIAYLVGEVVVPALRFPLYSKQIRTALSVRRCPLTNTTLMLRTELARRVGGYRAAGSGEDIDFVVRMCEITEPRNSDRVLVHQRIHLGSATFRASRLAAVGQRYALSCAKLRRGGIEEPNFESYCNSESENPDFLQSCLDRGEALATIQYRKHLIDRAEGRRVRAVARMMIAAISRPQAALSRISQRITDLGPAKKGLRSTEQSKG